VLRRISIFLSLMIFGALAAVLVGASQTPKAPPQPGPHPSVPGVYVESWREWKRAGRSAQEAARDGGWYVIVHGGAGEGFGKVDRSEIRDAAQIRTWAQRLGTRVGLLTRWRADVVGCEAESSCDLEGFDPSWLRVVGSDHPAADDLRSWREAGYTFEPSSTLSRAWWQKIVTSLEPNESHVPYTRIDRDKKRIRVRKVAADLCNSRYREWAVEHAAWQVSEVGADGIVMTNKWLFWPRPQVWHDRPDRVRLGGGVITDTPYGPGEYERCYAELIRELHARGLRIVLNTNGLPRAQAWRWMPGGLPDLVFGESRPRSFRIQDGPAALLAPRPPGQPPPGPD